MATGRPLLRLTRDACGRFLSGLLLVVLVASAWPSSASAEQGGPIFVPPTLFGMYGGYQDDRTMALVRQSGARLVRVYVEWASLQPYRAYGDGGYLEPTARAQLDAQLRRVTGAGLTALVQVGEAPDWAAPRPQGPLHANELPSFVRFMELLVRTYGAEPYDVRHWALWPEPDAMDTIPADVLARSGPDILRRRAWGDDGAAYAAMLEATYPAIKRISPRSTVVLGDLAFDWFGAHCPGFNCGGIFNYRFLVDVIAAGGACCFDVLGFNHFAVFAPGWEAHAAGHDLAAKTSYVRRFLEALGVRKQLMVLSAGVWSDGSPVPLRQADGGTIWAAPSAALQAAYVTKLYARAASADLATVAWYTPRDASYDPEQRGLVTENLSPKIAYQAYQVAADRLRGASFVGMAKPAALAVGELEGYRFVTADAQQLVVAWIDGVERAQSAVSLAVATDTRQAVVYDFLGQVEQVLEPQDGRITVMLTTAPSYIETAPVALRPPMAEPAPAQPPSAPAPEPAGAPQPTAAPGTDVASGAAPKGEPPATSLPRALPSTGDGSVGGRTPDTGRALAGRLLDLLASAFWKGG